MTGRWWIVALLLGTGVGFAQGFNVESGTNSGDVSLAAVGSSPNANGATLSNQILNLEACSATQPGVITTGAQTCAGAKTWSGAAAVQGTLIVDGGTTLTTLTNTQLFTNYGNVVIDGGSMIVGGSGQFTIQPGITAATGSSSVPALAIKPLATLDNGDLVLDVESANGTSQFKVDHQGMATVRFNLTANALLTVSDGYTQASGDMLTRLALITCDSGHAGYTAQDILGGGATGKQTKICTCIVKNDGTTFAWRNNVNTVASSHRYGTTTTCPDTDE